MWINVIKRNIAAIKSNEMIEEMSIQVGTVNILSVSKMSTKPRGL